MGQGQARAISQENNFKLAYFPLKARGFPTLLALEVGKVDYDPQTITFEEWRASKASSKESGGSPFGTPFGYLPLVTLPDGTHVNETNACLMAAGMRGNLLGSTEAAQTTSAMLACKCAEIFTEFMKVHPHMFNVKEWNEEKENHLDAWANNQNKQYLSQLEKLCNGGKFTTDGNTVGELWVFALFYHFKACGFMTDFGSTLNAFYDRVAAIPEVKKCCENKTKFGQLGDFFVPCPKPLVFSNFGLKARGFPVLLSLEVGQVDYNHKRVEFAEWPAMKASDDIPFGYLPLITLPDGTQVNETNACVVAAGIRGNLLGSTEAARATSSMLACKCSEIFNEFSKHQPSIMNVKEWNKEKEDELDTWANNQNKQYLNQLEKLCKDGKFTTDGNTVGELWVFALFYHFKACGFMTDFGSTLNAFYDRVAAIPEVKKCCENKTKFGQLGDFFVARPVNGPCTGKP